MHRNRIWIALLGAITAIFVWYIGVAGSALVRYIRYDTRTVIDAVDWSATKIGNDRYSIKGVYTIIVDGTEYPGSTELSRTTFRNEWAALQQIQRFESKEYWAVWYDSGAPAYSTLQKSFPIKECLTAALLFGIVLYFFGLGYYVARIRHK